MKKYLVFIGIAFLLAVVAWAASTNWPFTTAANYTYDSAKIEVSGGVAKLKPTNTGWYDSGWSKRRAITITGSTGGAQTNYAVQVSVTYDSDMQADFDDIRFTASDGTTLRDHWRESYTASTSAVFWVELPSIPASPSTVDIYMYYGNASASTASDGGATFVLFDDFTHADTSKSSGADVPYAPWVTTLIGAMTGGSNIASNQVVLDCDQTGDFWGTSDKGILLNSGGYTGGHSVTVKLISIDEGGDDYARHGLMIRNSLDANAANQALILRRAWETESNDFTRFTRASAGASTVNADYNAGLSSIPVWLRLDFDGNVNGYVDRYYSTDGYTWTQILDTDNASALSGTIYFGIICADAISPAKGTWDDFKLRKLVAPEPTVGTPGTEESVTFPTDNPTIVNNTGQAYTTSLDGFTETLGAGNQGAVKYHISNNGTNWYYHNGANWVAASGYSQTNTAAEVNTNAATFDNDVGTGTFYFKAFLNSDGTQQVELDQVDIAYDMPAGSTYYVRTDGSDSNTGTGPSAAEAWQTIDYASSNASLAGDTIYVAPGTYNEQIILDYSGALGAPIQFIGDTDGSEFSDIGAGAVIVDGQSTRSFGFAMAGKNYITLDGFTVRNAVGGSSSGHIDIYNSDYINISNCTIYGGTSRGIYIDDDSDNNIISDCEIYNTRYSTKVQGTSNNFILRRSKIHTQSAASGDGKGFTIAHASNADYNAVFENNMFYDNPGVGLWIGANSDGSVIKNNTFVNNDTSTYGNINNLGDSTTFFNNVFDNGTGNITLTNAGGSLSSDYNCLRGTYSGYTAGTNDLENTDPDLDATYHLNATSPCRNVGTSSFNGKSAPTDDIDGDPRPQGSGYDIGADEFVGGTSKHLIIEDGVKQKVIIGGVKRKIYD